jgi:hypothetical protein
MKFTTVTFLVYAIYTIAGVNCDTPEQTKEEKELEREIHEAFKAAFSNRSDEIQDFFNKTFGQGGNASDIADRFRQAWGSTSDGVKRFLNDTYWNISRIMSGNDTQVASALGYAIITERINGYPTALLAKSTPPVKHDQKQQSDSQHQGVLDTAWNYFKSVFGVTPKPTPPHHKSSPSVNSVPPPPATASIPSVESPVPHRGGLYIGILAMAAALLVFFQATFNRKLPTAALTSPFAKYPPPSSEHSQVPSGYVRIA